MYSNTLFINLMFLADDATDITSDQFSYGQVSPASNNAHAILSLPEAFEAPSSGFVVVYLSNESNFETEVYFDDLKVTVNESKIIQTDDYYPFGLTFNSYQRSTGKENKFLYNDGTERINDLDLGVDMTAFRVHDPTIGRWWQIDPIEKYHESPYAWVTNNPIRYNDPLGLDTLQEVIITATRIRDHGIKHKLDLGNPFAQEEDEDTEANFVIPIPVAIPIPAGPIVAVGTAAVVGHKIGTTIGDNVETVAKSIADLLVSLGVPSTLLFGPTADELISGSLKRSPSYDPRYGGNTLDELEEMAKSGDEIAGKMKKLAQQGKRLLGKNKTPKRGK